MRVPGGGFPLSSAPPAAAALSVGVRLQQVAAQPATGTHGQANPMNTTVTATRRCYSEAAVMRPRADSSERCASGAVANEEDY